MLFNSLNFLLFFMGLCIIYYAVPHRFKWMIMLVASIGFYMCFNPLHVAVLLVVAAVSYLTGLAVYNNDKKKAKKVILTAGIILSCLFLLLGKYADFFMQNIYMLLDMLKIPYSVSNIKFILPVGISFFTFKAVSYIVDAYRGKIVEKNFFRYLLYVSFFPQIASGPIERSTNLIPQFGKEHKFNSKMVESGLCLMLVGFFKKMVVADNLSGVVSKVFSDAEMYSPIVLFGIACAYSLQIFCDFSGYSDIAIGCTKVLGITTAPNFDNPYFSKSIVEFWRKWHISLSSWFKDYLYIPLGGNRKGKVRKFTNLMIVFLVSGLWHGASWNFIFWGFLHGLYQIIGALTLNIRKTFCKFIHVDRSEKLHNFIKMVITFILVTFAWIFFKADSIYDGFNYIRCMLFNSSDALNLRTIIASVKMLFQNKTTLISFVVSLGSFIPFMFFDYKKDFCKFMSERHTVTKIISFALVISFIVIFASTDVADFIYIRF